MKIQTSVVIPIYNEKESLSELFEKLEKAVGEQEGSVEYIAVDDGSIDGSCEELQRIKKTMQRPLKIIRLRKNKGKSNALTLGFREAQGEVIATIDADLQDEPGEIAKLIDKLNQGFGLVVGWRKNRKDPPTKILQSHIFNAIISKISGVRLHDTNSGLKVFTASAAKEIRLYGELHRFIPFLVAAKGFTVTEVPVAHHLRKFGHSKFNSSRIFRAFFDLATTVFLTSFENRPLQLFGPIGFVFTAVGLVLLSYLSVLHFLGQSIGRRPLLFLGILFVLFGVQLFSTGLIGELITNNASEKNESKGELIE